MKYKILLNKGITPKNTEGNMYAKICEAMEEYHKSELLKLNKSDVISSVCDCGYDDKGNTKICSKHLGEITGIL